jgi:hypothetical protein
MPKNLMLIQFCAYITVLEYDSIFMLYSISYFNDL